MTAPGFLEDRSAWLLVVSLPGHCQILLHVFVFPICVKILGCALVAETTKIKIVNELNGPDGMVFSNIPGVFVSQPVPAAKPLMIGRSFLHLI